jgi:hypothetical protein
MGWSKRVLDGNNKKICGKVLPISILINLFIQWEIGQSCQGTIVNHTKVSTFILKRPNF